jgi:hypothetical protein
MHRTSLATGVASRLRQRQDLLVADTDRAATRRNGERELLQLATQGPIFLGFNNAGIQVRGQSHRIAASRFHESILSNKPKTD